MIYIPGQFYLSRNNLKKYKIANINGLTEKSLYLRINQFLGDDCKLAGVIIGITPDWIDFLADCNNDLYDYTIEEIANYIHKIKEET